MERKDHIDLTGAAFLIFISGLLGINQALVKLVNLGMNPVFQAGMRSAVALLPVVIYALMRRKRLSISDGSLVPGILCGIVFALEFMALFQALDYTSVGRSAVLFYTMPVWVAVGAHFLIPGEVLTPRRILGLVLAVAGVAVALLRNGDNPGPHALAGDLLALLAAAGWAAIALLAKATPLSRSSPEMQLIYQLAVSAPILLCVAWLGGETFREMTPVLWGYFGFQAFVVVGFGFSLWFWVLSVYPASDMASYAFLTPLFAVFFGWLIFDEQLTLNIILSLTLVGAGIWLVNRRRRPLAA